MYAGINYIRMFLRLNKDRMTAWLCGFSYLSRKNVRKNVRNRLECNYPVQLNAKKNLREEAFSIFQHFFFS
jgi:hypothetical protein